MEALTKDEMVLAKSFCKNEKKCFWSCMYNISKNKHKLPFMYVKDD